MASKESRLSKPPRRRRTSSSASARAMDADLQADLRLVAIGTRRTLPSVARWTKSCATAVDADGRSVPVAEDDLVALFESKDRTPVCHLLHVLAERLHDRHANDEPLDDGLGHRISVWQYGVMERAARKHLPSFAKHHRDVETKRIANALTASEYATHQGNIARLKRSFQDGEIDRRQMQRQKTASANAFDLAYAEARRRSGGVYDALHPSVRLTTRLVEESVAASGKARWRRSRARCGRRLASRASARRNASRRRTSRSRRA